MTQPDVPSELECSVCLQLLHEPASLPCGHSFCLSCARRSLSSNRSCPLCRRACYGAVQTNLALTHALRMLYPNVEPRRRSTSHADVAVDSLVLPPVALRLGGSSTLPKDGTFTTRGGNLRLSSSGKSASSIM